MDPMLFEAVKKYVMSDDLEKYRQLRAFPELLDAEAENCLVALISMGRVMGKHEDALKLEEDLAVLRQCRDEPLDLVFAERLGVSRTRLTQGKNAGSEEPSQATEEMQFARRVKCSVSRNDSTLQLGYKQYRESESRKDTRSLLIYYGTDNRTIKPWYGDALNPNIRIASVVTGLAQANNAIADSDDISFLSTDPAYYRLYDWNEEVVDAQIPIRRIARPGIILALPHNQSTEPALVKQYIDGIAHKDAQQRELLDSFLVGVRGSFEPVVHEVLISYTHEDSDIAYEIRDLFSEMSISCFMFEKDIKTGVLWEETIRNVLSEVRAAVVLLTPRSVDSNWVLCEMGALWALKKPLFPALLCVEPHHLPELILQYAPWDIKSRSNRKTLCSNLADHCDLKVTDDLADEVNRSRRSRREGNSVL